MQRRTFIKSGLAAGVGGVLATGGGLDALAASAGDDFSGIPDLVGVKGGEPDAMFDRGIAAMGGMGRYVKRGQTVVVKPNIGWARTPEAAANTNPRLVRRIVEHCFKAGAREVYIFDHTCNNWHECYEKSGMNEVAKATGAKLVTGNHSNDYCEVKVTKGVKLKSAKTHRLILECDVFINVPVLKNHGGAVMTCAMKNLMGIVQDRGWFHKHDLQQCIADYVTAHPPDLNVVDAYRVMLKGGPRGHNLKDVELMKYQMISSDIVAVDTAASKVIGIDTARIPHIRHAEELGLGSMNLAGLKIKRIKMS